MKFKYSAESYDRVFKLLPFLMLFFSTIYYTRAKAEGVAIYNVIILLILLNSSIIIISTLSFYWFRHRRDEIMIIIDDEGIFYGDAKYDRSILWNDISNIEVLKKRIYRSGGILIETGKEKLKITADLDDFKILITTIKENVGDRFPIINSSSYF